MFPVDAGLIEDRPVKKETDNQDRQDRKAAHAPLGQTRPGHDSRHDRGRPHQKAQHDPVTASGPGTFRGRHGDQHGGKATKGHEAHDADVEKPGKAPLQVDP